MYLLYKLFHIFKCFLCSSNKVIQVSTIGIPLCLFMKRSHSFVVSSWWNYASNSWHHDLLHIIYSHNWLNISGATIADEKNMHRNIYGQRDDIWRIYPIFTIYYSCGHFSVSFIRIDVYLNSAYTMRLSVIFLSIIEVLARTSIG